MKKMNLNIKEFNKICKKADRLIQKYQDESEFFEKQKKLIAKLRKNEMN